MKFGVKPIKKTCFVATLISPISPICLISIFQLFNLKSYCL